jgi:hypothetical protein
MRMPDATNAFFTPGTLRTSRINWINGLWSRRLRSERSNAHIGSERKQSTSIMAPWFLAEQVCHNRLFSLNFFSDGLLEKGRSIWLMLCGVSPNGCMSTTTDLSNRFEEP